MINDKELKVIIGHKPPVFEPPSDWRILTKDLNNSKDFFIEDNNIWTKDGNQDALGEYSDLIVLAEKLEHMPEISSVRIAQYRKIVINSKRISSLGPSDDSGYIPISKNTFKKLDLNVITTPLNNGFLISDFLVLKKYESETIFNTLLNAYNNSHYIEDFLRFVADCVTCKVLNRQEANLLLHMNKMIVIGIGIGTFPTTSFLSIIKKVKTAITYYYENSWVKRDEEYQYRYIGFCAERLSSFLLMQELYKNNIKPDLASGKIAVITDEKKYNVGK